MSQNTSRTPLINWDEGFATYWFAGDPVLSHIFNALSFMFPQGEKYFMRIARSVRSQDSFEANDEVEKAFKLFIRQEATHTKQHEKCNSILEQQGLKNRVNNYIPWFIKQTDRFFSPINSLAIVCAYEHFTAVVGDFILRNQDLFQTAEEKMALLWGWHGAEETEHKSVCFDIFIAAGGTYFMRLFLFSLITINFLFMFYRNLLGLLWQDHCFNFKNFFPTLWRLTTFFWGRRGISWHFIWHSIRYWNPYFHPWSNDNKDKLEQWLKANEGKLEEFQTKPKKN